MNSYEKIQIIQHKSSNYPPRTYQTAKESDLTIAIAVKYDTAGERLTEKAATNYLRISYDDWDSWYTPTKESYLDKCFLGLIENGIDKIKLNIAGNSIGTFARFGITQSQVNKKVFDILSFISKRYSIIQILSGGQTGTDTAGVVAALALGIPVKVIFPNGFLQRNESNNDFHTTENDYLDGVLEYAEELPSRN